MYPFYTIGHSTRSIEEFVQMLRDPGITLVADVRTVPRSRTNPQYNLDALPQSLAAAQIEYEHIPALGGLRGRNRDVAASINAFWQNESFHNYADYAMGETFRDAIGHLMERGRTNCSVIMCAEAVWWRCHRRIIADYLLASGKTVLHILAATKIEPARLTAGARKQPSGILTYPGSDESREDRLPH